LNQVEQHLNPDRLVKLTASALSTLQSKLRATKIKETTIASVLRHVRAAIGWAVSVGMLAQVPKMVMPKRAKGRKMKGGALVGEQFERMVVQIEKVLFPPSKRTDKRRPKGILTAEQQEARRQTVEAWKRYLTGLWLSGLRLSESIALSWDYDAPFVLDLSGRHPRFRIQGEAQKSGKDELLPLTPDAAEFFLATPEAERVGPVFRLMTRQGRPYAVAEVGALIAEMGEKAGVVVAPGKTASAHDLRRSFGTRWAKRVAPAILQKLMRHSAIQTTMGYYVDLDVDEMADELWEKHHPERVNSAGLGNNSGNNLPSQAKNDKRPATQSDCRPCI
jgi:integrase